MEEEDEPLLPREKLLRYDVTLLKKGIYTSSFKLPLCWQPSLTPVTYYA